MIVTSFLIQAYSHDNRLTIIKSLIDKITKITGSRRLSIGHRGIDYRVSIEYRVPIRLYGYIILYYYEIEEPATNVDL